MSRDYYCSNKFKFLKIDMEQKTTYNCHAAKPHTIDMTWLHNNPGQIFNTPINVEERLMMLDNQRNKSCEQNCYRAEDRGAAGPRIIENHVNRTHTNAITTPEWIDLTISSECNLTCSYCCREFSSAWRQDLAKHGSYTDLGEDTNRYQLVAADKLLMKVSQKDRQATEFQQTLNQEMSMLAPTLENLIITGGEPFLNNDLLSILETNSLVKAIKLFSGLGVNPVRFEKLIAQIANYKNITVAVSMENVGHLYEFNRYGSTWQDCQTNLETLKKYNIKTVFHATLTNLTIHGFVDFYNRYKNSNVEFDLAHQPTFMPVYVIDDESKARLLKQFDTIELPKKQLILQSLILSPTKQQQQQTATFLKQFVKRRPKLSLSIFPTSFLQWLDIDVVQ